MKKYLLTMAPVIILISLITVSCPVPVAPLSTTKAITAFSFASPAATGFITESAKTIAVTVPYGTDVTALVATFTHTGVSATVGGIAQVSGTTANNFTNQVVYHVTAADSSFADYTVTVTVALNSAKQITAFAIVSPAATGTIDQGLKTIAVTVPFGTDVTALVATFTNTGASITVGGNAQVSGTTVNSFTNPVVYRVTAADSSFADYTVTVTVGLNSAKQITAYAIVSPALVGTIDQGLRTIALTVPFGTNVSALVATFSLSQFASATVNSVAQVSGTTPNNFTSPVVYRVTAQDATWVDYTVTVRITPEYVGTWKGTFYLYGTSTPVSDVALVLDETNYRVELYTYPGGTTLASSSTRGTHGSLNPNVVCTLNGAQVYDGTTWIDSSGPQYMQYAIAGNSMDLLYYPSSPLVSWLVEGTLAKQ